MASSVPSLLHSQLENRSGDGVPGSEGLAKRVIAQQNGKDGGGNFMEDALKKY